MILSDQLAADLAGAVHRRSWDWFLELPYRLDLAAEILDDKGAPVLPPVETHLSTTLRRLLLRRGTSVQAAFAAAIQSKTPHLTTVEHLDAGFFPLIPGGSVAGVLVLARERGGLSSVELQSLGSWLTSVILAHLATTRDDEEETFDRVASLHELLNHAVSTGNTRDVVGAFAEALTVWDDIEVRGYIEDLRGKFVLEASLAGSDPDAAPPVLDDDFVDGDVGLVRLSRSDVERLGFRLEEDVFIAGFGKSGGEHWFVALSGRIAPADEPRLALSINMLREAVRHAERIAAARVDWAILQHLLVAADNVEPAAQAALKELTTAVDAANAALIVTTSNGMQILSIGDAVAFSVPGRSGQANQIVSTLQVLERYTMVLALRRSQARAFMRRDQQVVDSAALVFASWLSGILQRPEYIKDRRAGRHRFQDVVERLAEQTVRRGGSVSVVVMAASEARFRPEGLRKWVTDIRGRLREADLVGTLTESEIAILLSETTAAEAAAGIQPGGRVVGG
jgi:hypothetical protein